MVDCLFSPFLFVFLFVRQGLLAILALRVRSKTKLGAAFDVKEFHDVMLCNGSLPLVILEEVVDAWIERKLGFALSAPNRPVPSPPHFITTQTAMLPQKKHV